MEGADSADVCQGFPGDRVTGGYIAGSLSWLIGEDEGGHVDKVMDCGWEFLEGGGWCQIQG